MESQEDQGQKSAPQDQDQRNAPQDQGQRNAPQDQGQRNAPQDQGQRSAPRSLLGGRGLGKVVTGHARALKNFWMLPVDLIGQKRPRSG